VYRTRSIFTLILAGFVSTATAETEELVTFEDCFNEAVSNNPALFSARESVNRAEYDLKSSYSLHRPDVTASADYSESGSDFDTSDGGSDSMRISANQSIFTGFGNTARIERNRAALEGATAALETQQAQVLFDLRTAFTHLLFAQEQVTLTRRIAARRKDDVDLVNLRFESGSENKGAYLRTRASDDQAKSDVHSAERELRVAQRELASVLGRDLFDTLIASGRLEFSADGEDRDFRVAARTTPRYREAAANVKASESDVRLARSEFYPSIAARAAVGRLDTLSPPEADEWSVGIGLSFPLYRGKKNVNSLYGAEASLRKADADLKDREIQLALDLEQAFAAYHDAIERQAVRESFLLAAETRAKIARAQYASGLIGFQDWDQIESELINAEIDMLASRRNVVDAEARWNLALGLTRPPDKPQEVTQ